MTWLDFDFYSFVAFLDKTSYCFNQIRHIFMDADADADFDFVLFATKCMRQRHFIALSVKIPNRTFNS